MSTEDIEVISGHATLTNILVIEETRNIQGKLLHGVPIEFHHKGKKNKRNLLQPLDDTIKNFVVKLHIIYPSVVQFYCARHLQPNPHYTVRDGKCLSDLVRLAHENLIPVQYYNSNVDHLDGNMVCILNNIHLGQWKDVISTINLRSIVEGLGGVMDLDKEHRGTFTSHVGFSATLGQGWHNPYGHLDELSGVFGLCKPGITTSMSSGLQAGMGPSLSVVGLLSHHLWGVGAVNNNDTRQQECSKTFATHLGCDADIVFEAGTFAQIRNISQQLAVHTDVLNDSSPGYEKTGVLSYFIQTHGGPSLITVIGYNRRCCREFMSRLGDATSRLTTVSQATTVLSQLPKKNKSNLQLIEEAACEWLRKRSILTTDIGGGNRLKAER